MGGTGTGMGGTGTGTGTGATVVVAPDSFKGTATAAEIAEAIGAGWASVRPSDRIILAPMADGGEGTLDAFELAAPGAARVPVTVQGPDDRDIDTYWLRLPATTDDPAGVGVVELAATSGLTLMRNADPLGAHTYGFGQAIASALDHRVSRVFLAIGGSASTDGGAGALAALGARFLDARGHPIPLGNTGLATLARVDLSGVRALPPNGAVVLMDVTNPLLGASGAAAVFGPQKGADAGVVAVLDANLGRLVQVMDAGRLAEVAGAGAAGGTGFALLAWGARAASGAQAVGDALGMAALVAGADVVIAGEGRFDSQSDAGKAPSYIARLAAAAGTRAVLVAGSIDAPTVPFAEAVSLSDLAGGSERALAHPLLWARAAGAALARTPLPFPGP